MTIIEEIRKQKLERAIKLVNQQRMADISRGISQRTLTLMEVIVAADIEHDRKHRINYGEDDPSGAVA
jgi:hypothetical protein